MEEDGCRVRGTTPTDRKNKKRRERGRGGERAREQERGIEREKEPLNTIKADVIKKNRMTWFTLFRPTRSSIKKRHSVPPLF